MSLNKKIILLIKRKKMKLAIAESCTGGMLASSITAIRGSSKIFTLGLITYSNKSKNVMNNKQIKSDYIIKIYALNYNVLIITKGMVGLGFSC